MPSTTFHGAIEAALSQAMAEDPRIVVLGEDVEMMRRELYLRFGARRVRNTPVSESAILGAGLGAAMAGLRPVVEIMFVDFVPVAMDMLVNHVAKLEAFSNGDWTAPLVVRAACGGGYGDGGQHQQALWGMLSGIPGLVVAVPSTPADAAGLMLAAVRHPGPVVFLEHKLLSRAWLDVVGGSPRALERVDVPEAGATGEVTDPIEPAELRRGVVRRPGEDLAIVSIGVGVHRSLAAAQELASHGLEAAVLDLRTAAPLDVPTILALAESTRHVLVVDEDYARGGLSGEIAAVVSENDVPARFARVTCEGTIPYARSREQETLPNVQRIVSAACDLVGSPGRRAPTSMHRPEA